MPDDGRPLYIQDWEREQGQRDTEPISGQLSLIPEQVPDYKAPPRQGRLFE